MSGNSIDLTQKEVLTLAVQIAAASITRPADADRALRAAIELIQSVDQQGLDGFLQSGSDR